MIERAEKDRPTGDNPVVVVRHQLRHATEGCSGLWAWVWCPGCQQLHAPLFPCPDHPESSQTSGPRWEGDPRAEPFSMEPSLLVRGGPRDAPTVCHSFIRNGQWEFLGDSTHALAGQTVPLEPLPDWLSRSAS